MKTLIALLTVLIFVGNAFAIDTSVDKTKMTAGEVELIMAKRVATYMLNEPYYAAGWSILDENMIAYYSYVFDNRLTITRGCFGLLNNCEKDNDKNEIISLFKKMKEYNFGIYPFTKKQWLQRRISELRDYFVLSLVELNVSLYYDFNNEGCIKKAEEKFHKQISNCPPWMILAISDGIDKRIGKESNNKEIILANNLGDDKFINWLVILSNKKIPYDRAEIKGGKYCKWSFQDVKITNFEIDKIKQYLRLHKGNGMSDTLSYSMITPFFNWFVCYSDVNQYNNEEERAKAAEAALVV